MSSENKNSKAYYEYSYSTKLTGMAAKYIAIPESVILSKNMDTKKTIVFSYFLAHKGLNDEVFFSIPDLVRWCGFKPDSLKNGTSSKFIKAVNDLKEEGYLIYSDEISKSTPLRIKIDSELLAKKINTERFAILYLDEVDLIRTSKKCNEKDGFMNSASLFLVFSFLRLSIFRRPNKFRAEEIGAAAINHEKFILPKDLSGIDADIMYRRLLFPEVYDNTFKEIGRILDLSERVVSNATTILEEQLGLIATRIAYRIVTNEDKIFTPPTLFANAYKREKDVLLVADKEYIENEFENKVINMKKFYDKRYRIK